MNPDEQKSAHSIHLDVESDVKIVTDWKEFKEIVFIIFFSVNSSFEMSFVA